jgi:signal transduction histidine kinase/HAMP domain-containing protein
MAFRVAMLSWLLSSITLAVFLVVSLPQQSREFQTNLQSKARGVAASIRATVAGAAVSEDYSSVVDHTIQVLEGDAAIEYLVITKNDGYSILTQRDQWTIETLDQSWRPQKRMETAGIREVTIAGRRVFHFSAPFDYSGLEWGWIHIGLSLETYDASVQRNLSTTLIIALVCIALSLLVSALYAQRLMQPVRVLHTAMEQVSEGNLNTRADLKNKDEIGELAEAFNGMTAAILTRNRALECIGDSAQQLVLANCWQDVVGNVLQSLGLALGGCCVYVLRRDPQQIHFACELECAWQAPELPSSTIPWRMVDWTTGVPSDAVNTLEQHEIFSTLRGRMLRVEDPLTPETARMLRMAPVVVGDALWGALCLETRHVVTNREGIELESLRAVAHMLGAAILRRQAQEALLDANNMLERRVMERTQELNEQVLQKEAARQQLEEVQQSMVDLSRRAGMAEVATGVLHNVGNVLNSLNVAATVVCDRVQQSKLERLDSVTKMLVEHQGQLDEYVRSDSKGMHVLPYLSKLSGFLLEEREQILKELTNMSRHVGHIKEIVAAQQNYATTAGFVQSLEIKKVVQDALSLSHEGMERHGIGVMADVPDDMVIFTDKHKVLQIILNLLQNAKDALKQSTSKHKQITVRAEGVDENRIRIVVLDNGVGMSEELIGKLFRHGFTTKPEGHGFGLHSGANAARELGGSLAGWSAGPGNGSAFTLELPVHPKPRGPNQQIGAPLALGAKTTTNAPMANDVSTPQLLQSTPQPLQLKRLGEATRQQSPGERIDAPSVANPS